MTEQIHCFQVLILAPVIILVDYAMCRADDGESLESLLQIDQRLISKMQSNIFSSSYTGRKILATASLFFLSNFQKLEAGNCTLICSLI